MYRRGSRSCWRLRSFATTDPTVVIVPGGGEPTIKAMGDQAVRDYLRRAAETVPVVGSVCTG